LESFEGIEGIQEEKEIMKGRRQKASRASQSGRDGDSPLHETIISANVNRLIMAIMTAGGKVLKEEYGFNEETIGEWALKTAAQAKEYLRLTKDEGRKTMDEGRKTDGRGSTED